MNEIVLEGMPHCTELFVYAGSTFVSTAWRYGIRVKGLSMHASGMELVQNCGTTICCTNNVRAILWGLLGLLGLVWSESAFSLAQSR
jgi:hypothetical protein